MVVIQVTITHPGVPVIGGCSHCKRSIRSQWYDRDTVIDDPLCDACEDDMVATWENEITNLAAKGDETAIQALINMRFIFPEPL